MPSKLSQISHWFVAGAILLTLVTGRATAKECDEQNIWYNHVFCKYNGKEYKEGQKGDAQYYGDRGVMVPKNFTGKVECDNSGNIEKFSVKNGRREGLYQEIYNNKLKKEKTYVNNCAQGPIKEYRDGKLYSETQYSAGEDVGPSVNYRENGKIESISAYNSNSVRMNVFYDDRGQVTTLEGCDHFKEIPNIHPTLRKLCGLDGKQSKVAVYSDGRLKEETGYLNGLQEGPTKRYDDRGKETSTLNYSKGLASGTTTVKDFSSGVESKVVLKNGQRHGDEIKYYPGTKLKKAVVEWKGDQRIRETGYYQNGNKERIRLFKDNKIEVTTFRDTGEKLTFSREAFRENWWGGDYEYDGPVIFFNKDGSIWYSGTYKNGERDGTSTYYFSKSKKPSRKEQYEKGTLKSAKNYDSEGRLVSTEEFFADGSKKVRKAAKN